MSFFGYGEATIYDAAAAAARAADLPAPATPAFRGEAWWMARVKVLESQRQADLATIDRLRGDLARAGLALDALTAPEATS